MAKKKLILVEGILRTGKKEFASALAERMNYMLVQEQKPDPGLLRNFYLEPEHNALVTELYFLVNRYKQLVKISERDIYSPSETIMTFSIEKSRIYASLTLTDDELKIYDSIYPMLSTTGIEPDLVIYLFGEPAYMLKRIREQKECGEEYITREYVEGLVEAFHSFYYRYSKSPVVFFDMEDAHGIPLDDSRLMDDFEDFLDNIKPGVNFYVPRISY